MVEFVAMGKRLLFLLLALPRLCCGATLLRSAAEVTAFQQDGAAYEQRPFVVTGRVNLVSGSDTRDLSGFLLEDSSGIVDICVIRIPSPTVGDIVAVRGLACLNPEREPWFKEVTFDVLGHEAPPAPLPVRIKDLSPEKHHLHSVETRGTVIDIRHDDIDGRFDRLHLKDEDALIPVSVLRTPENQDLLDAEVVVRGTYTRNSNGYRKFAGPQIEAFAPDSVAVLRRNEGLFECPPLENKIYITPQELLKSGRRRIAGSVLATWNGNRFLVRTATDRIVSVCLNENSTLPAVGTCVTVVGYPVTDSFRINLTNARYRTETDERTLSLTDSPSALDSLFYRACGQEVLRPECDGRLFRLSGRVIALPSAGESDAHLDVLCRDRHVHVDVGTCPEVLANLTEDCVVEATGVCVLAFSTQTPYDPLPRITGFTIVLRTPADLRIVARPPWWTPARLAALVGILLIVLVAILIWNLTLQKLAERRGRALLRAQVGEIRSALKTEERTRLAVELHDSLAQTLTGVSMEIETASRYGKSNPDEMLHHHDIAARALKSCRNELRNSLWDLRNQSLDGINVDEAIKLTLFPHLKGVALTVRFNVLRNRLTDNFLHEILRIIRELALNGIHHGGATAIRVAGGLDGNRLVFSVRDNGTGFDAASAPGVSEGHFGLQGVRERLNRFNGHLAFSRLSGGGTKASVSMDIPAKTSEDGGEQ